MPVYKRRPPKVSIIRYSCINGKAVWLYRGQSHDAMRKAYWRARRHEMTLQRKWPRMIARRAANIRRLLDECLAAMPIIGELTPAQRTAVKTLKALADKPPEYDTTFYNHILGERRRRDKKSRRWHRIKPQEA